MHPNLVLTVVASYQIRWDDFGVCHALGSGAMFRAAVRADFNRVLSTNGSVPAAAYIAISADASCVACAKPKHHSAPYGCASPRSSTPRPKAEHFSEASSNERLEARCATTTWYPSRMPMW